MIHHFQLRKGMVITIALPTDLAKKDVDRMSTWLKFNLFEDDEEQD